MSEWLDFVNNMAASAGPYGQAFAAVSSSIAEVSQMFGRGRREADIISPIANQLVNPNGSGVFDAIVKELQNPNLSQSQLQEMRQFVASTYAKYDAFTREPRFIDGRASEQARQTMRPVVDNILNTIDARISGAGPLGLLTGGPGGNGNGVLYAGAAVLGAKLLGFF